MSLIPFIQAVFLLFGFVFVPVRGERVTLIVINLLTFVTGVVLIKVSILTSEHSMGGVNLVDTLPQARLQSLQANDERMRSSGP